MGKPRIKPVSSNASKNKTYASLIKKYNDAMSSEYYGEAELIVYEFLEDRLRSFIYYSDLIDTWNGKKINENAIALYGGEASINNISTKVEVIIAALNICTKNDSEQSDFEKSLIMAYNYSINHREFVVALKKIIKWCNYRNEIVHAMFNKDIIALREGYAEHVKEGFELARYVDKQVQELKKV